jgi:hypothetical protein
MARAVGLGSGILGLGGSVLEWSSGALITVASNAFDSVMQSLVPQQASFSQRFVVSKSCFLLALEAAKTNQLVVDTYLSCPAVSVKRNAANARSVVAPKSLI